MIRRSRIRGVLYCRETLFNSIRRQADGGVWSISRRSFGERRRSVMNWNPQPVQLVELGVGRQLGVEDQFLGVPPGPLLPEPDEAEDLVVLLVLAQLAVGIAEDAGLGVLGQEGQHPLLPPAPLGDVVLLDQGVLAVEGDRVEVEVERMPPRQTEPAHGVEPVAHQLRVAGRGDPATVLGQERSLGDDVQAGEEGQPFVEDGAHDVAVACGAEELQGQQRPQGAAGGDHLRSGEPAPREDAVEGDRGEHRQEEEQAAELGAERLRAQIELPDIGDIGRGRPRAGWALVVSPARQAGEAFVLEDLGDGDRAEGVSFVGQIAADVVDRRGSALRRATTRSRTGSVLGRTGVPWPV